MNFRSPVRVPEHVLYAILLLLCAGFLLYSDGLWRWDRLIYDWYLSHWSRPPPEDVIIIAIDEQSLMTLGRWPWSRQYHAELIDRLSAAGARAVALNVAFAEPRLSRPTEDAALVKAVADNGQVVLPILYEQLRPGGQLVETLPMPTLTAVTAGIGHVDLEPDRDGIVRSVFLKAGLGSAYWPNLALAVLKLTDPDNWEQLPGERNPETTPITPYEWIRDYRIWIRFAGPRGHFNFLSFVDALRDDTPESLFRDRFVFVGATAAGLGDTVPTPVSGQTRPMSGIEVQANVFDTLRRQLVIRSLDLAWSLTLTGSLAVLPVLLYARLSLRWMPLAAGGLIMLPLVVSLLLLRIWQLWFPPLPALITLALSYPLWNWRHLIHALRSLGVEKERTQVTLKAIGDAVITTDSKGLIDYMNPVSELLLGRQLSEIRGRSLDDILQLVNEQGEESTSRIKTQCLESKFTLAAKSTHRLFSLSGQVHTVRVSAAPIQEQSGKTVGMTIVLSDISAVQRLTRQIEHRVTHDFLTNLPNRNLLQDQLNQAISRAHHTERWLAILLINLDRFRQINTSLGHAIGDRLLKATADRLKSCIRKGDIVARLEGDEFAVLLEDLAQEDGAIVVAQKVLETMKKPFFIEQREFYLTSTIGVSLFPANGDTAEVLLKNAYMAMHQAKEQGRNTIQIYAPEMNLRATQRLNLENGLRHALENRELLLYYQPQINLKIGTVVGVETLLRWRHPELGMVSPGEFIPLAEETGLIVPIGAWVLHTACVQAKQWRSRGLPLQLVAVNLSPRQFVEPGLPEMVAQTLQETGLPASCLELELTESLLMQDVEGAIQIMHALKAIGVKLSIDDFGTGFSSLNYLKKFPIDRLKIDQSFVRDLTMDPNGAAIVLAIISLAHSLNLDVVAEGVEHEAQLTFLQTRRCEDMQGYYFSRPLPPEELDPLLQKEIYPITGFPTR